MLDATHVGEGLWGGGKKQTTPSSYKLDVN